MCELECMWENFPYFPQTKNELLLFLVVNNVVMFVFFCTPVCRRPDMKRRRTLCWFW